MPDWTRHWWPVITGVLVALIWLISLEYRLSGAQEKMIKTETAIERVAQKFEAFQQAQQAHNMEYTKYKEEVRGDLKLIANQMNTLVSDVRMLHNDLHFSRIEDTR